MKKVKKLMILFVCLSVCIAYSMAPAISYAKTSSNITIATGADTVSIGGTFTVTLATKAMKVSTFTGGISFDRNKLEVVSVAGGNASSVIGLQDSEGNIFSLIHSTAAEANKSGTVGFGIIGTKDKAYTAGSFAVVTFKVKAEGTAAITVYEDTAGTNAYKSDSAVVKAITLTAAATGGQTDPDPSAGGDNGGTVTPADSSALIAALQATKITYPNATSVKAGKVRLTWKKTGSTAVDGFVIYRSASKNGKYAKVFTTKTGTVRAYANSVKLKSGRTYWFKVRGFRVVDGVKVWTKTSRADMVKVQ